MKQYQVGDYLVFERAGVCQVDEISEKALMGKGSEKMYYSLHPVFEKDSRFLTPVNSKVRMRDLQTPEEIDRLFDRLPEIEFIDEKNPRAISEIFKKKIAEFTPDSLASVVKTIYLRQQMRMAAGKKAMLSDEKIMNSAGRKLFEEIAFVRRCEPAAAEKAFYDRLTDDKEKCIRNLA